MAVSSPSISGHHTMYLETKHRNFPNNLIYNLTSHSIAQQSLGTSSGSRIKRATESTTYLMMAKEISWPLNSMKKARATSSLQAWIEIICLTSIGSKWKLLSICEAIQSNSRFTTKLSVQRVRACTTLTIRSSSSAKVITLLMFHLLQLKICPSEIKSDTFFFEWK